LENASDPLKPWRFGSLWSQGHVTGFSGGVAPLQVGI